MNDTALLPLLGAAVLVGLFALALLAYHIGYHIGFQAGFRQGNVRGNSFAYWKLREQEDQKWN